MEGKIEFQTNVPVELSLQFLNGKEVDSNYGSGKQHLFTTTDGRRFWVSDTVGDILAQQIAQLGVRKNEPIAICKREVDQGRGRKGIRWFVERVGFVPGEQRDGTYSVPAAPATNAAGAGAVTPTPVQTVAVQPPSINNGHGSKTPDSFAHTGWAIFLLTQTNTLVDVYAAALRYASEKHGNQVKPEDVRALMTTCFINVSKNGGAPMLHESVIQTWWQQDPSWREQLDAADYRRERRAMLDEPVLEEEPEPACECRQIDVDLVDARGCAVHGEVGYDC